MMRLAYLCLEVPVEGHATYVHVKEIAEGLRNQGWIVDRFSPIGVYRRWHDLLPLRLAKHLHVQMKFLLSIRGYDVVYIRAHPIAFLSALVCRILRKPVVHEVNGTYSDIYVVYPFMRYFSAVLNSLQRAQYRWSSGLIAVTPRLADWLREEAVPAVPRLAVISNGANLALFSPEARPQHNLPERYVVFAGGLSLWHGVSVMLDALESPFWPEEVSLVVVGDGPEAPRIREATKRSKRLVWIGRVPYAHVPGYLTPAIAGLVPISDPHGRSNRAGVLPLKLYEAMACGIPVIASDLPCQKDVLAQSGCGLIFPHDDSDALAQAVAKLAKDDQLAKSFGARGLAFVRSEGSWEHRAMQTSAFLSAVLNKTDGA